MTRHHACNFSSRRVKDESNRGRIDPNVKAELTLNISSKQRR
jgi:hypothetical protein